MFEDIEDDCEPGQDGGVESSRASGNEATFEPYRLVRFADIEPNLANNYLVKGLIDQQSLIVLYGTSGNGKSFLATDIALAIASGRPWRGARTRKGKVIYVAAEGGRGMENRLYGARQHLALGPADSADFSLGRSTVRLTEDEPDIDHFIRTVVEHATGEVDLVVIDALSRSMAGGENSSKDMMAAVNAATLMMEQLGCAVLIVHHSGKNEANGMRGSSSLKAAIDTELELKKDDAGIARLRAKKQKEAETGGHWMHRLEVVEIGVGDDGDPLTAPIIKPLDSAEAAGVMAAEKSGKPDKLARDVVKVCLDLHAMKKAQPVPREVLAESGYLAFMADQGWDVKTKVQGSLRSDVMALLVDRNGSGDEERRECDEKATGDSTERKRPNDRKRNAAKHRIRGGIDNGALFAHGEWVWLKEPESKKATLSDRDATT